jgi:hypothetical protein
VEKEAKSAALFISFVQPSMEFLFVAPRKKFSLVHESFQLFLEQKKLLSLIVCAKWLN